MSVRHEAPDKCSYDRPRRNSVRPKLHEIDTSTNESPELHQCATYQFTGVELHHYKEGVCGKCTGSRNMKVDHGLRLVGECYGHGIMASEGFKEKDASTIYLH